MTGQTSGHINRLRLSIDQWLKSHNTTWTRLMRQAGLAPSVGTDIRRGARPKPETLSRLAKVMGVSQLSLAELAGLVSPAESLPELQTLASKEPEIWTFFQRGIWDELTAEEREFIRMLIRGARDIVLRRRQGLTGDKWF